MIALRGLAISESNRRYSRRWRGHNATSTASCQVGKEDQRPLEWWLVLLGSEDQWSMLRLPRGGVRHHQWDSSDTFFECRAPVGIKYRRNGRWHPIQLSSDLQGCGLLSLLLLLDVSCRTNRHTGPQGPAALLAARLCGRRARSQLVLLLRSHPHLACDRKLRVTMGIPCSSRRDL